MTVSTCPECDGVINPYAGSCACGWKAPKQAARYVPPIVHERHPMSDEARERLNRAVKVPRHSGEWWAPERVVNQAQASFVKVQADHFGSLSPAGRFFQLCVDRGCVDESGIYLGPARPLRHTPEYLGE